jgi:mannosylglycerate hydrolase MGH1-like protein
MEHFISASGDTKFLEQNWPGLEAAYRYCESLLNADDGLPRIPSTKEGGNEQDRIADDLNLSTSWVDASAAFARLATLSGHAALAEEAMRQSKKASNSVARRYWDDQRNSWIDGYDQSGHPVFRRSDSAVHLVPILDQRRSGSILDQVASSDFETDWGTRGVAASSPRFDPDSYASGSVSPVATGAVAAAFWSAHRPYTAFPVWRALTPWGTLDSMGHIHELLTGDFYHQQIESVPEQTWSSAAFLSSTVHGLLGLARQAKTNFLEFSPHLPTGWDKLAVSNIKVTDGSVAMTITQRSGELRLQTENSGTPVNLIFSPQIPFGAHLTGAELDGKPVNARLDAHAQDTHATVTFILPKGKTQCLIRYEGGVSVGIKPPDPLVGDSSKAIKLTAVTYQAASLVLNADVRRDGSNSTIELRTTERPLQAHGAKLSSDSPGLYELTVDPLATQLDQTQTASAASGYRHIQVIVDFAERAGK